MQSTRKYQKERERGRERNRGRETEEEEERDSRQFYYDHGENKEDFQDDYDFIAFFKK